MRPAYDGPGVVALVGGGPGDPELITVRGQRLLHEADVVVTDRLGPRDLLTGLDPDVEIVDVGKTPYCQSTAQHDINGVLVDRASRGLRVVRLKGGDPFVFGRGGEEVAACRAAGIEVEVVPGVSSALAAPAAAGVPVTHRGITATLVVVSAHLADGSTAPVDWPALARLDATLVVLMGVGRLPEVVATLLRHGRDGSTPAAVVERATLPDQRVVDGRLDEIAELTVVAAVRPPAVLVVGEVVRLRADCVKAAAFAGTS